ncbi:MAG: ADP-ribosylglycohydrolase family protein [Faecousia sp.]
MYGAIIGDIAGSTLEFRGKKNRDFPFFLRGSDITDDTIMTIAAAAAVFLAKTRHSKEAIRDYIHSNFYPMDRTLEQIRPDYSFDGTCQGSVPEAIIAFLESGNFEDAIRNVISLGGDADTMGAITGSIAWSFYRFQNRTGISSRMAKLWVKTAEYLPEDWLDFILEFDRFCRRREDAYQKTGMAEPFVLNR